MSLKDLQDRLKSPIMARVEPPPPKPMIILNSLSNPNIILVEKPVLIKEVKTETITYGYVEEELKQSVLNNIINQSDSYKDFVVGTLIPLYLGFDDMESKVLEDLDAITEGNASISLSNLKKVIEKTGLILCVDFITNNFGLSKAKSKKIAEVLFNETLERIRYSGDRNSRRTNSSPD